MIKDIKIKKLKTINGCDAINSEIEAKLSFNDDGPENIIIDKKNLIEDGVVLPYHKKANGFYEDDIGDVYPFDSDNIYEVGKSIIIKIN